MKITVIGSGTMGSGIAHVFAQYGHDVALIDNSRAALEKGLDSIKTNIDRQIKKGTLSENDKKDIVRKISLHTEVETAVEQAELCVEAATENLRVKLDLFRQLDKFTIPSCILATNTSSISITSIANETKRPDKVIGMHFMNPVPLMKLVEVIKGKDTSAETTEKIVGLTVQIDKVPVEVNDSPGFVANRILIPMINEAIFSLYEGVAGITEIDTVMKLGMSHPMGPLQLADFIGLDICLAIMKVLYTGFNDEKYRPCPLLVKMVETGNLGVKTGCGFYDWNKSTKETLIPSDIQINL
ncbi:MAG: 3-hydroxyacyl-CoA dehydrogenase family protein [Cytophagaceae bacterium]